MHPTSSNSAGGRIACAGGCARKKGRRTECCNASERGPAKGYRSGHAGRWHFLAVDLFYQELCLSLLSPRSLPTNALLVSGARCMYLRLRMRQIRPPKFPKLNAKVGPADPLQLGSSGVGLPHHQPDDWGGGGLPAASLQALMCCACLTVVVSL